MFFDEKPMENAIEIKQLETHYGNVKALKNITASIPRGKTTVILGGSGCGKSTLLKHLIGLLKPTSGTILINDKDITTMNEYQLNECRRHIGILFQGAALLNSMTVSENIALPLKEHTRLNAETINIMVRMKLDLVGLSGFDKFYPSQLSGGMKKRAGIARAMAMDPEFLFFDEPSAGLDPVTAAGIDELILRLKSVFKMTITVITHELASVFMIADYVIMLEKGQMLFAGSLEELKESQHPAIRRFLERQADTTACTPEDYFDIISASNDT